MTRLEFSVRFWGVRGSMATASSACSGVGGNTSCVEVRAGDQLIILDAGTGLYQLGETLSGPVAATFLFSHFHWDHIQGFPFFSPLYAPESRITIAGPDDGDCGPRAALDNLMAPPHFPVTLGDLAARCTFRSLRPGGEMRLGPVTITAARMNHPQECLGYRIAMGDRSVVYATDTEPLESGLDPAVLDLARGAQLLIYDAQYTDAEYRGLVGRSRKGWGHSTIDDACRVARAAEVERLVLFHHDPSHDDAAIERMTNASRALFPNVCAAREGLRIEIPLAADQAEAWDRRPAAVAADPRPLQV